MGSQDLISKHLRKRSPLSELLSPLGSLYGLIQSQRRKRLSPKAWRAPCRVISVGNLTAGGSGKTPLCIHLVGVLNGLGLRVGVSHRGYRGSLENTPTLVSDGHRMLHNVNEAGDEAWLISQRLPGIPVVVGKQRVAAVSLLLAEFPDLDVVILDDAFQHLGIARDLDIVCIGADTGCGNGRVLPAGYLREPLSALEAASLLVVTHKSANSGATAENGCWASFHLPLIHCRLQARDGVTAEGKAVDLDLLKGDKLLLISGVADPDSVEETMRALGLSWLHHFRHADHYAFANTSEIRQMAFLAQKYEAQALLCTEKDLAKLARHAELRDKLLALRMDLVCEDEDDLMGLLRQELCL
ncbi:MAG: tetraacyldisaccharide 4'-kinase [Candidatus Cloacimonetes bacterium]|nr:tetraacyldisaccharide 4'-kinase [Candidatus Cloacimonadota bacterium]